MKHILFILITPALIKISYAQPVIGLQQYASGFSSPVDIANCGDERLFIVERSGYIRIIDGQGNVKPQPFLDIDFRVRSGGEEGLLGLVFHPDYKNNGHFFVYYTDNNGDLQISRYSVSTNPDVSLPTSEVNVINIGHPIFTNHNGGDLEFGPDGYLYIATGDGGSGGNPTNSAQNGQSLLGKILRLDVDVLPYRIPPDNPFVNDPSVADEIWALGLRNPWRFCFDRLTGDMWIADVGQNAWEEVNFQPASSRGGENYGWRCYEGNNAYNTSGCAAVSSYVFPVFEYSHTGGRCSVTGGFVYRGCAYPNLFGSYIFCDYCSGNFYTIKNNGGNFQTTSQLALSASFSTFGEDMNGEVYVASLTSGIIYRITETSAAILPAVAASPGTSFCPGGSITLTTQSGFTSYVWKLNDTTPAGTGLQIIVNQAGKYTLTVTGSNGCVYTTPGIVVTAVTPPAPVISAPFTAFCHGDSVQLTTSSFSSYAWSDGSTAWTTFAKQSGSYTVTVTDAFGCTGSSAPFSVTENPLLQPVISATAASFCQGDSLLLTTGSFSAYAWSNGSHAAATYATLAGNYTVTVTDNIGCTGISSPFEVTENPLPQPVVSAAASAFCSGDSVRLTAGNFAGYAWSNGSNLPAVFARQGGNYSVTVTDMNGCSGTAAPVTLIEYPRPQPVVSAAALEFCEGDSVELTTGSFAAYAWWDGSNAQSAFANESGNYTVTVTDVNGCTGTAAPVFITKVPRPQPAVIQTGFLCAGNTAVLSTDQYAFYEWSTFETSPQIIVTQGGVYAVTVTDTNGCSGSSLPYTVLDNQIAPPDVTSSNGTAFCEGNSTTLNVSTGYASYLWSTGSAQPTFIVWQSGSYTISVTDTNGCVGAAEITIHVFPLPTPQILPGNNVIHCGDGLTELTTLEAYASYSWSSGDTVPILSVNSSGIFNVTVTDVNGCQGVSDSVNVNFVVNPPVTEIIQPSIGSNVIYARDSGYHYQWYADGILLPDDTFQSLNAHGGIAYTVELTDQNGCSSISQPYYLLIDNIRETWLHNVTIQPNPFGSKVILHYTLSGLADLRIRLLDFTGKELGAVLNEKQTAGFHTVSLNADAFRLSAGMYFLEIQNGILRRTFKVVKI